MRWIQRFAEFPELVEVVWHHDKKLPFEILLHIVTLLCQFIGINCTATTGGEDTTKQRLLAMLLQGPTPR